MSWIFYILSGLVAVGVGIYFGLPGRYDSSIEEIDRRLGEDGEHAKVDRKTTVITILRRTVSSGSQRRRDSQRRRRPFNLRD